MEKLISKISVTYYITKEQSIIRTEQNRTEIYYDLSIQAHRQNNIYTNTNFLRMQQCLKTHSLIK